MKNQVGSNRPMRCNIIRNNKVAIVHVITGLYTGGAEMMLYKLLSTVNQDIYTTHVISLMDEGTIGPEISKLGIPVHTLRINKLSNPFIVVYRLVHVLRKINPGIVQGWMYHANFAVQIACFFLPGRTKVVWNIRHSLYKGSYEKIRTRIIIWLSRWLSRFPSRIIYNSYESSRQHEAIGYKINKSVVLPNGFDIHKFHPAPDVRVAVRNQLELDDSVMLIGMVARYHPVKDHATFLQAASLLNEQYPDVHFLLAGRGVSNRNPVLYQLVKKHGIEGFVHLFDEVSDTHCLMPAFDIFSLSSLSEGFSNVIGEAMACGVPCVVTDVGDSALIVGDYGKVVERGQPVALCRAWVELLRLDGETRREMGKMARQRIVERYSLSSISTLYDSLYQSLISTKQAQFKIDL
jgi:glycosyltransferase involved in cell wall biosynthesis